MLVPRLVPLTKNCTLETTPSTVPFTVAAVALAVTEIAVLTKAVLPLPGAVIVTVGGELPLGRELMRRSFRKTSRAP